MKMLNGKHLRLMIGIVALGLAPHSLAQKGIWTSAAELALISASGPAWEAVLKGANQDCSQPDVSNQEDNTNVYVLAAAVVYARTGDTIYKDKVVAACEQLAAGGHPEGNTLAWARETGAYALAADLVGYRDLVFATWLLKMAEIYVANDDRTMRDMFEKRPNNWGAHAFGSLCAIYSYIEDTTALREIRDYWVQGLLGPNPGFKYDKEVSWHADSKSLRLINPKSAVKEQMNIDGVIPDDLRRGNPFRNPPDHTDYPWEFLQGVITAARILERAGLSIWAAGDSAIYRAAQCLQIRFENSYGQWAAAGDDEWMLSFLDQAYGTQWSANQQRLWEHGKNAGWGYVAQAPKQVQQHTLQVNVVGKGDITLDPPGERYAQGTVVILTATPGIGWAFIGWSGDLSDLTNPAIIVMSAGKIITATFSEQGSNKEKF
ncbi:MAG: InlB B-repeat-containing protein [bacterium]